MLVLELEGVLEVEITDHLAVAGDREAGEAVPPGGFLDFGRSDRDRHGLDGLHRQQYRRRIPLLESERTGQQPALVGVEDAFAS